MDEIKSLEHNHTWTIVKKPESVKLIDSRWIFKRKADTNGDMTKCKARLVARGYMQKQGIDFTETYAPVARLPTIRLLLSVGIKFNMLMEHLDVKTVFLNGDLKEPVFMKPPEGIFVPVGHVLKLQKSLYGLKQLLVVGMKSFTPVCQVLVLVVLLLIHDCMLTSVEKSSCVLYCMSTICC